MEQDNQTTTTNKDEGMEFDKDSSDDFESDIKDALDQDEELLKLQRRKSRPSVVISEFVEVEEEPEANSPIKKSGTVSKEITHVQVDGNNVS